jgi:hypothetical protein
VQWNQDCAAETHEELEHAIDVQSQRRYFAALIDRAAEPIR